MDVVNADYGIDAIPAGMEDRKWYRWHRFPLLPIVGYRPEDRHNRMDWWFNWLNFRVWSMMSPDIGFEICLEDMGLWFKIRLPYMMIHVWLLGFPQRWHQKLWRTKEWSRDEEND